MFEVRRLGSIHQIPSEAWDAVAAESASPFVEWTWLACLEESGCVTPDAGWLPNHFAVYESGKLVALAPSYIKGNSEGEFVFDFAWADLSERLGIPYYPKIILSVPFTPVTGERVLIDSSIDTIEKRAAIERIIALATKRWAADIGASSVHLLFPRESEIAAWEASEFSHRVGIQYQWFNSGYSTFEEFLSTLPSKRRTQIRREVAQPAKDGITIETLSPSAITPSIVRTMYDCYLTTVDKFIYGRRYLNLRFFELVAERFAHRLAWVLARKDGEIIASAFNLQKGNALYGRYWGTVRPDMDIPFLHFNVCYYHGIQECIARGIGRFEPGAGGEHKRVRGFVPTITHSAHWIVNPRIRRVVGDFLARERAVIQMELNGPTT